MTIDIFIQSRMFSETKQVVFVPETKTKVFNNINNNPKVIIYVNLTCLISFRSCRCRLKSQQLMWQRCVKYSDCIKTDVQFHGATPLVA